MVSKDTIDLIKTFEGFSPNAYPDPATGGEPTTIGYGTTKYPDGNKVKIGDIITITQAEGFLANEVGKTAVVVNKMLKGHLSDNQFGALVSFAYNLGTTNLKKSTLLRKVNINSEDPSIRAEFLKWNKASGKVMPGMKRLTRRRAAEADLYFKK